MNCFCIALQESGRVYIHEKHVDREDIVGAVEGSRLAEREEGESEAVLAGKWREAVRP